MLAKDPGVHDEHIEEPIEDAPLPTCPACGVTRSRDAVPYSVGEDDVATYTCTGCGAQFESWVNR